MININVLNEGISNNFSINPISGTEDESYGIFGGNSHQHAENSDVLQVVDSKEEAIELAKEYQWDYPSVFVKSLDGTNTTIWDSEDLDEQVTFTKDTTGSGLDNIDQSTGEVLKEASDVEKIQNILVNCGVLRGNSQCTLYDDNKTCLIQLSYLLEFTKEQFNIFKQKLSEYGLKIVKVGVSGGSNSYGSKENKIYTVRDFSCEVDFDKVSNVQSKLINRIAGYTTKKERQAAELARASSNPVVKPSSPVAKSAPVQKPAKQAPVKNNNVSSVAITITNPTGNPIYTRQNGQTIDARDYEPQKCTVPTPSEGKWILIAAKDKMKQNITKGSKERLDKMDPRKLYHRYFAAKMIGYTDFISRVFENSGVDAEIIAAIDQYFK